MLRTGYGVVSFFSKLFRHSLPSYPRHRPQLPSPLVPHQGLATFAQHLVQYNTNIRFETSLTPRASAFHSIGRYKSVLPLSNSTSSTPLDCHQWTHFWSLSIPLNARTIWYRVLYQKLPTKRLLHCHNPSQYPAPSCPICRSPRRSAVEDDTHFLFLCPLKIQVWSNSLSTYVNSMISHIPNDIIHILQHALRLTLTTDLRNSSLPFPSLSLCQTFACTILSIWQAHWKTVFEDVPFVPVNVISSTSRLLARLDAEQQLDLQ